MATAPFYENQLFLTDMDRRQYLTTLASIGVGTIAGCSVPGGSQTLSNPTTEQEDDGETHLLFHADGDRLASLTIQPGRQRYSGSTGEQISVDVSVAHRDGTKIAGLRLKLRTLSEGGKPPAQVALITPFGTPHPSMELYTDPQDGGAILDIADTSEVGDGTLTLKFLLTTLEASTSELEVDATIELTEQEVFGADYTLDALTLIQLPDSNA